MALPEPVLGPLAKRAMRTDTGGKKRLRLLVLIAAFADAGGVSPPARGLCRRLGIEKVKDLDHLLKALARDGHLEVGWRAGEPGKSGGRKNIYRLRFGERNGEVMKP